MSQDSLDGPTAQPERFDAPTWLKKVTWSSRTSLLSPFHGPKLFQSTLCACANPSRDVPPMPCM